MVYNRTFKKPTNTSGKL